MQASKKEIAGLAASVERMGEALRRGTARAYDPVRVGVLRVAAERGRVRPGEVAEILDVLPSSVTRHVQVLAELGHLVVTTDPSDRRASLIEITESGREQMRQFSQAGVEVFGAVVADWSAADVQTLTALLERLMADWAEKGTEQQRTYRAKRRFGWSET
ncbi:MarR family winged helix-turn-helix transcriptional regulator [Allokutzneria albata]|uniref:DNA-binding transcriptional regulator, MarR family n=1 Tax=Allokutzneria albata TaxID=211114 RepID=A0A1G9RH75_ALLAB|nr:MarR family transcriptional regulator [Allokutzneria albata]SDM22584.1 DNA-binding transcriptional regulator, MarR family [Allokutzneria albata]